MTAFMHRNLHLGISVFLVVATGGASSAAVIEVPADHATTQAPLNAAGPGDTIEGNAGLLQLNGADELSCGAGNVNVGEECDDGNVAGHGGAQAS